MSVLRRLWRTLPPGFRVSAREWLHALGAALSRWRFWRWELVLLRDEPGDLVYLGRTEARAAAVELFATELQGLEGRRAALAALRGGSEVVVSEVRLPAAIRVPLMLRMVVEAGSDRMKLRGYQRRLARQHRVVAVERPEDVERINAEMLVPFALERHGPGASLVELDTVCHLARVGRLHVLYDGDREVAAHLGFSTTRRGRRVWEGCRYGYPAEVFGDPRRLADVNAINLWYAMRWTEEHGYDVYDMGRSLARPEGGLLQFKKRRGGTLDAWGAWGGYWLRVPAARAPRYFWATPQFGLEPRGVVLHVGLWPGRDDDLLLERFQELGYDGLAAVRLHAVGDPSPAVRAGLRGRFGATPVELVGA